jgi:hypothetical protein
MAGIAILVALGAFAAVAAGTGTLDRIDAAMDTAAAEQGEQTVQLVDYVLGAAFLFVAFAITIFFNSALIAAALERLRGGDPSVRSGLRAASAHLPQILAWAAISTVVTLLLNALRERGGIGGRIAAWIGGAAWGFATFFVIPVLVSEGIGPIEAIRRSSGLFTRTWGRQAVSSFGFGIIYLVAILGAALVSAVFFAINPVLGIAIAVPLVALAFGTVQALEGIFKAALYEFAKGGAPVDFNESTLRSAYRAL